MKLFLGDSHSLLQIILHGFFFFLSCLIQDSTAVFPQFSPTAPGSLRFTPTIQDNAHRNDEIPLRIEYRNPQNQIEDLNLDVSLYGARDNVSSSIYAFRDSFEGSLDPRWVNIPNFQLGLSVVGNGVFGSAVEVTYDGGVVRNLGFIKPKRLSFYGKTPDTQNIGPIILMSTTFRDCDIFSCTTRTASVLNFSFGNGRVQFFRATPSNPTTAVYGPGPSIQNDRWYKIDIEIDLDQEKFNLWVDGRYILEESTVNCGLPCGRDISFVNNVDSLLLFNDVEGFITHVDELQLVENDFTLTSVNVIPSTISLENGIWEGSVRVLEEGDVFLFSEFFLSSGQEWHESGVSNAFTVVPECQSGQVAPTYFAACQDCNPGFYSPDGTLEQCLICERGTFNSMNAQSECSECPQDTYNSNEGSINQDDCLSCPGAPAGSVICTDCLPGQESINNITCADCNTGFFSQGGEPCEECATGKFANETRSSRCLDCPPGTYNDATGQSECLPCPVGTYSTSWGSSFCLSCPIGSYQNETRQTSCKQCPSGTVGAIQNATSVEDCEICQAGSYSLPGLSRCLSCSPGFFSNTTGSNECLKCSAGTVSASVASTNCTICEEGTFASEEGQAVCIPCSVGFFADGEGSTSCQPCPVGSSSRGIRNSCYLCDIGTFSNETGSPCYPCPEGFSTNEVGSSECSPKCGNARLDTGEFCDDGNGESGDGCTSTCEIEDSYECNEVGKPCTKLETNYTLLAAIVGSVVGFLIIAAIVVGIFFLLGKKKKNDQLSVFPMGEQPDGSLYQSISSIHLRNSIDGGVFDRLQNLSSTINYSELVLEKSKILGYGAFGVVFTGEWRGRTVAIKEIKGDNLQERDVCSFVDEADLMCKMQPHRNVVLFIGIVPRPFCIVSEYLEKGDLKTYLENNEVFFQQKLSIMSDVAAGMMHLTLEGIIHRDLACRNVLLSADMQAKVSDFGLSRLTDGATAVYSVSEIGPLKWMPPEAIRFKKYSEKSDVWSFGITCWEILNDGAEPYPGMDAVTVATSVVSEGTRPILDDDLPVELKQIIWSCFATEPENRPNFAQLHKFFSSYENS